MSDSKEQMKGGKQDSMPIQKEEIVVEQFYDICPVCKRKIPGKSKEHVEYNMRLHLETHGKEEAAAKKE